MINITDTMSGIRYLFEKYKWMAGVTNAPMPKETEHRNATYQVLSQETQDMIRELHNVRRLTYAQISRQTKVSKVAVRRVCLGLYKGKRTYG